MLYSILKPIIGFCLKAFFRKITIIGRENLEIDGPAIYVSNHPNAFLDPLILATTDRKKFHYIAGAEWFGKGLRNYIFRYQFNMIPVIRPWLKTGEKVSNDEMFEQCYQALSEGKRIVIYPEGTSVTVSSIRELKTGAIRIKIGGDKYLKRIQSKWPEVKIVPVGLNYYAPRTFQSDVVLNVGEPIDFSHIKEKDESELIKRYTEETRNKMSETVFHFEEEGFDRISKDIYRYYGAHLRRKFSINKESTGSIYQLQKGIMNAVHYFHKKDPSILQSFQEQADKLRSQLDENQLDIRYLGDYGWHSFMLLKLIVGLPIFLVGWILNITPFRLTRWIFEKFLRPKFATTYEAGKLNPSFLSSMVFLLGMILFLLWYVVVSLIVSIWTGWWWLMAIMIITGYLTGVFAARYARTWFDFYKMTRVVNRRRRRKKAYKKIKANWDQLIVQLDFLQEEFDKANS
ncbi:MAG: 1-acyl-sn-glycerol-3-phosphate acyltransferase [Cyclobacteriaceae bacterium]